MDRMFPFGFESHLSFYLVVYVLTLVVHVFLMAYVLAGGRGSRLMELTDKRAKPAVFFGGKTRIIDFALSNALNSGIRRIAVEVDDSTGLATAVAPLRIGGALSETLPPFWG